MEELIRTIITPLIDDPDSAHIIREESPNQVTYILSVSKEDMGKVIGKNGAVATAIRTILSAAADDGQAIRFLIRE
ncbi:MAG: KH domain-containing protein [Sporolactobacillus sp.]